MRDPSINSKEKADLSQSSSEESLLAQTHSSKKFYLVVPAYGLLCMISYYLFLSKIAYIIYYFPQDTKTFVYYLLNYLVSYIIITIFSFYMIKKDFAIAMRICSFIIIIGCILKILSLYYNLLNILGDFCMQNTHPIIMNGMNKMSSVWYRKKNVNNI